jgi:hypothetical protein
MKKLYNKETGQEVSIEKINVENNHVVYSIKDAANNNIESTSIAHKLSTYHIKEDLFRLVNISKECLSALQAEKLTEFVVEEENQNWLVADRAIRMLIPIEWLNEVLISDTLIDVAEVITREQRLNAQATNKHVIKGDKHFVAYFNSINQTANENGLSDFDIMMPHVLTEQNPQGKIIVEQKV